MLTITPHISIYVVRRGADKRPYGRIYTDSAAAAAAAERALNAGRTVEISVERRLSVQRRTLEG